jgi:hypothetical protein
MIVMSSLLKFQAARHGLAALAAVRDRDPDSESFHQRLTSDLNWLNPSFSPTFQIAFSDLQSPVQPNNPEARHHNVI